MGEPLIGRIEGARHGHQPTARSMIHLRESLAGFDQDELAPVVERAQLTETPVEQTAQLEWKIGQLSPVTQDAPGDLRWVGDNKTPADHEGRRGGVGLPTWVLRWRVFCAQLCCAEGVYGVSRKGLS